MVEQNHSIVHLFLWRGFFLANIYCFPITKYEVLPVAGMKGSSRPKLEALEMDKF